MQPEIQHISLLLSQRWEQTDVSLKFFLPFSYTKAHCQGEKVENPCSHYSTPVTHEVSLQLIKIFYILYLHVYWEHKEQKKNRSFVGVHPFLSKCLNHYKNETFDVNVFCKWLQSKNKSKLQISLRGYCTSHYSCSRQSSWATRFKLTM